MNVLIIFTFIFQPALSDYDRRVITTLNHSQTKPEFALTIVNGDPAGSGSVPYLVSIKEPVHKYEIGKVAWKNLCGGSIIGIDRILTAAHCFESSDFYFAKRPELLRIVAGNLRNSLIHSGETETTDDAEWRTLIKIVLHKEYVFPHNDIALGTVNQDWSWSDNVQPIKLATENMDYDNKCNAAGYGRVGPNLRDAITPVLLVAQISILSRSECSQLWEMDMNGFICSDTTITDVARGDSGGPLVCTEPDSLRDIADPVLVGVVSGKNYDKTSLYTRVSAYNDWIVAHTNALSDYDRRVITTLNHSQTKPEFALTIVNGEPAGSGSVPYLVSIKEPVHKYEIGKVAWKNLCGGSIISKNRILTAAHCFESSDFYFAKRPELLRIVAGNLRNSLIHSGETETTDDAQWRTLIKIVLHKEFVFPHNDIALGTIDQNWSWSDNVQPIKLATENMDYDNKCNAAGYGRVGPNLRDAISPVLLVAQISILSRSECSLLWEMDMNSFICSDTAITDVARGDSGGPLVCTEPDSLRDIADPVLVGVVSGKNYDKTSLYTRVSAYNDWILALGFSNSEKLSLDVYSLLFRLIPIYTLLHYVLIYHLILITPNSNGEFVPGSRELVSLRWQQQAFK